jgi:hypothetical protein
LHSIILPQRRRNAAERRTLLCRLQIHRDLTNDKSLGTSGSKVLEPKIVRAVMADPELTPARMRGSRALAEEPGVFAVVFVLATYGVKDG